MYRADFSKWNNGFSYPGGYVLIEAESAYHANGVATEYADAHGLIVSGCRIVPVGTIVEEHIK